MKKGRDSGLRAGYVANRVYTAAELAKKVIAKKTFSGHKIGDTAYGSTCIFGDFSTTTKEIAKRGGFEIHNSDGEHVATVHLPKLGKPSIEVTAGNKKLGQTLAAAFKAHANYWRSPKVTVYGVLPPVGAKYDPHDYRAWEKTQTPEVRMKREARRIRR
ncbi:MAG: hypothetical protein WC792_02675 [Candidatus Micrarchaeia archaeon]